MQSCLCDSVEMLAARQCAPVLTGIKPANILVVKNRKEEEVQACFAGTGVSCRLIDEEAGRAVWFIYRENKQYEIIRTRSCGGFLETLGYAGEDLEEMLDKMAVRFRAYQAGEGSFPHEMGIFLGYPLEDVKGFIEHEGKDYLYQGYWKVYGDVEKCKKMFSVYNRVKAQVVEEIEKGKALWQAAVSTRVPA